MKPANNVTGSSTQSRVSAQKSRMSQQSSMSPGRKKKGSTMSMASHSARKSISKGGGKEEAIAKKIQGLFDDRENKKAQAIKATIFEEKTIYKKYRKEHEKKMDELESEKKKIQRRKKNKKEKVKALRKNTIDRLNIICKVIKQTFQWYEKIYFENDFYRNQKLLELQAEDEKDFLSKNKKPKRSKASKDNSSVDKDLEALMGKEAKKQVKNSNTVSPDSSNKQSLELSRQDSLKPPSKYQGKKFLDQLQKFFKSPFKDDQKFAVHYMAQLTRDRLAESEEAVNRLFYDTIFNILLTSKDEINKHKSFEIISNMVNSDFQRNKLVEQHCFQRLFEKTFSVAESPKDNIYDQRILERLSLLITLISYHKDMTDLIISQNILGFILKISDQKYSSAIRSNSVLAISLLTYNELLFDEIIKQGVIDLIMNLCQDQNQDRTVQEFSTLALVHFALNKKSINILIEKGVLDLFDTFGAGANQGQEENVTISTNISWIFLALCNNGITGSRMLYQGITRDMFLVSCNPEYQQIRHLVITGFAELGKSTDNQVDLDSLYSKDKQRIKETSIVGMHEYLTQDAQRIINILLKFCNSKDTQFQHTAFWALKDYILLTHDNLIPDITPIIQAFIIGCVTDHSNIQSECADAISFLVTHRLVYSSQLNDSQTQEEKDAKIEQIKGEKIDHILDSIMYLSGNESKSIGTTAFSTLSSLSKFSSTCPSVMAQIERDIKMDPELTSKNYLEFIKKRLIRQKEIFQEEVNSDNTEEEFSGLYSLLRLAQDPCDKEIEAATDKYIKFISKPYDPDNWKYRMNEKYFLKVFIALKNTREPKILQKLLKVIQFYINIDEQSPKAENSEGTPQKMQKFEATSNIKKIDISDDSRDNSCQQQIINPHTILWMLGIIEDQHQGTQKYLSCLTSQTLLNIVSRHEIQFDYQEVAIIKKFNKALQNIDVFDPGDEMGAIEMMGQTEDSHSHSHSHEHGDIINSTQVVISNKLNQEVHDIVHNHEPKPQEIMEDGGDQSEPHVSHGSAAIQKSFMNENSEMEDHSHQQEDAQPVESANVSQEDIEIQIDPNRESQRKSAKSSQKQASSKGQQNIEGAQSSDPQRKSGQKSGASSVIRDSREPSQKGKSNQMDQSSMKQSSKAEGIQNEMRAASVQILDDQIQNSNLDEDTKQILSKKMTDQNLSQGGSVKQSKDSKNKASLKLDLDSKAMGSIKESEILFKEDNFDQESPGYIDQRRTQVNKSVKSKKSKKSEEAGKSQQDQGTKNLTAHLVANDSHSHKPTNSGPSTQRRRVGIFKSTTRAKISSHNNTKSAITHNDSFDTEKNEEVDVHDIDPKDLDAVDQHLRDSLIKAFMVIFTNEKSQHLLLNKDLIDIAFNCLEFCSDCTVAAKRHVARLISIIFKFPQVQERLLATEVVTGICELLNQNKHIDIIRYTIKACTYISMNYEFIKESQFSLDILKSMMTLLDKMNNRNDQFNIIMTIKNILKGDKTNKIYFLENGGTLKFLDIILESNDMQIVEMCIHAIREQASFKKFMVKIIQIQEITYKLKLAIQKCLDLTEDWHHDINLKDFEQAKKNLMQGEPQRVLSPAQNELTQDSKFSYSIDDSQIQIPEFMKNDLQSLNLKEGNEPQNEEYQITRLGKIRNSTYYIVARAIKFGFEARFLLEQCNLTQKILKDLSLHKENDFLFQNLLLIVSNLKLENHAIVDLIGNHYDQIFDLIYETSNKDRRVSLLKVLINLILEASEQLSPNTELFKKIFEICKDQRSDESMIENVLWFSTSLCEQGLFNQNFYMIMENMKQNQILLIIWKSLCSKSERIILQALRLLTNLADTETFRQLLFSYKDIFIQIKQISVSTDSLQSYKLEIQTELCKCLDKITIVDHNQAPSETSAAQKIDQIKIFNKYLINLAIQNEYNIKRLDTKMIPTNQQPSQNMDIIEDLDIDMDTGHQDLKQPQTQDEQATAGADPGTGINDLVGYEMDDIERISDSNEMVENIICTLSNISNDHFLHRELIQNGLIEVIKKFIDMFLEQAQEMNYEGINEIEDGLELNIMPVGALNLIKAVTIIIMNISSNPDVQIDCVQSDLISVILASLKMRDYEVTTHLYRAMGSYLTSQNQEIRRRAVHMECLQEMLVAHETSEFFRIRRICSETLNNVASIDPQMFELNDKLQLKKQKQREQAVKAQMDQGIYNIFAGAPGAM